MAYEKYIKKDGKLYGPYIYHSKRVDGKVISEYHGQKKINYKKALFAIPIIFLFIFGAYLIGNSQKKITGNAVLDLNANYQEGKILDGTIKLSTNSGELIPSDSNLIFQNAGQEYNYKLGDLISSDQVEGNFYVAGKNISGSGPGFGIEGTKTIYPQVYFILIISSPTDESNLESQNEIQGTTSAENPFTYELQSGETAEIKPLSVRSEGLQLKDNIISLSVDGQTATVSTDYSQQEQGFGKDYTGDKKNDLAIDLNKLNLSLQPGTLQVGIFYNGEELNSLQTNIGEGKVSETVVQDIKNITPQDTNTETNKQEAITNTEASEIPKQNLELTDSERNSLYSKFGNTEVQVTQAIEKNGFITIRYEIGDYWVEHSYDATLSENDLQAFIQQDRIKFLKDIADNILNQNISEQNLSGFIGNYPY